MQSRTILPESFLQNRSRYRSSGQRNIGAGFVLKPTEHASYAQRTLPDYVLIYVLRGSGVYIDDGGRSHPVRAGDAIQLPSNQRHGVVQNPDGQWFEAFVLFDQHYEQALVRLKMLDLSQTILHPGIDLPTMDLIDQMIQNLSVCSDDQLPVYFARATEVVCNLYIRHRRRPSLSPNADLIDQACRWIGQSPHKRPELQELLNHHGISYERFRKVFRQMTGHSPHGYWIRRRIDHAKIMLTQQRLSVKQVAYQLGYPDPFSFSRQFKKVAGISPSQFH
ncbi:MAG: hypothetical protein KatS3mg104_0017 [Phycisphaerae bacterium]|jgi:AraC-like DNA-binding protein/quercetin dioxygenase-like cupin family protein|nr:MAG: hypothetical protein KatS3mg104_0017 [Phycisphaerae bacterium]